MPRKPKYSREELIEAAVELTRESGFSSVTARSLGKRLGTAPATVFTHFHSLNEIRQAAVAAARQRYENYVQRGLQMKLPFKGFAMQYVRFGAEEPELFRLLFMSKAQPLSLEHFLSPELTEELIQKAIPETFGLDYKESAWLCNNMWVYTHGLAVMCVSTACSFTEEEIAELLGMACRGQVMLLHSPNFDRTLLNDFSANAETKKHS